MVKEEVKKILTHLTVTDELTPFHFEFFYDINAEKIVFCEVGKRFGGGKIPTLIQESFNINILEEYWQLLFLSDSDLISSNLLLPSKISTYYQATRRDGEVKSGYQTLKIFLGLHSPDALSIKMKLLMLHSL